MDPVRVAALLAPFLPGCSLSRVQLAQVRAYLDLLLRWNRRINLTAVRRPEQIVTRHFGESFFAACHLLDPTGQERVLDLGSGAGFPGLPLNLYAPGLHLTLIESQHKKAAFLREAARTLTLTHVNVFAGRAQSYLASPGASPGDLVTLRAVEQFARSLPAAAALVVPGGRLALMVGKAQLEAPQVGFPQWIWEKPVPVPESLTRVLLVGRKPKVEDSK